MAGESKRLRITELLSDPTYCRRYNGATYDDYDSSTDDLSGAGTALWGGATHVMYWGWSAAARSMGYRLVSAPTIGAITWQYSTGASSWTNFAATEPYHDSTDSLTENGYLAWSNPPGATAWAAHTHGGALPSAYWIRASIASYTSAGMFLNFLRGLELYPPLRVGYRKGPRTARDINNTARPLDLVYTGPIAMSVQCALKATQDAQLKGLPNLTLLMYWHDKQSSLFIEDLAQGALIDLTSQSFYKDVTGYLESMTEEVGAVSKMGAIPYSLAFTISSCTRILE